MKKKCHHRSIGASRVGEIGATVRVDSDVDDTVVHLVRLTKHLLAKHAIEQTLVVRGTLTVGHLAVQLTLAHRNVSAENCLGLGVGLDGLPRWPHRVPYLLHIEDRLTLVVDNLRQSRVEVGGAEWCRDADHRRVLHLHQWNENLVEQCAVHVGGLFAVDHIGRHTLERVRSQEAMRVRLVTIRISRVHTRTHARTTIAQIRCWSCRSPPVASKSKRVDLKTQTVKRLRAD